MKYLQLSKCSIYYYFWLVWNSNIFVYSMKYMNCHCNHNLNRYIKGLAKRIQKICSPYDIRTVFTSGSTLWRYLFWVKPPMEFNMIKNCVYFIPCSCGKIYKVETGHPQKVRLEEHQKAAVRGEIEKLGIVDHIWKEKGKPSALMGWSWNNW